MANPFTFSRIEYEKNPTICVPELIITELLAGQRCATRIEGPRGSGKSAILFSLTSPLASYHPYTLDCNSRTREQLQKKPAHIGLYCAIQKANQDAWLKYNKKYGENDAERFFSAFLEYYYIYLFACFLAEVFEGKHEQYDLSFSPDHEHDIVCSVWRTLTPDPQLRFDLSRYTFHELRDNVIELWRECRNSIFCLKPPAQLDRKFAAVQFGDAISCISEKVFSVQKSINWEAFILMDDCDDLFAWQARVCNRAIEGANSRIKYVQTSLPGAYKTESTRIKDTNAHGRSLSIHDRKVINLSFDGNHLSKARKRYENSLNRICRNRLEIQLKEESVEKKEREGLLQNFSIQAFLGKFDVEDSLLKALQQSENQEVKKMIKETGGKKLTDYWLNKNEIRRPKVPGRKEQSEYLKKWRLSAALSMSRYYKLKKFPYNGETMLLALSGGSVREALRIMNSLWEFGKFKDVESFLKRIRELSWKKQRQGFYNASDQFLHSLDPRPMSHGGPSLKGICDRFGEIFESFLTVEGIRASAETTSISVSEMPQDAFHILKEAENAGAIWMRHEDQRVFIALNPILAPVYKLTYRSPFSSSHPFSKDDIKDLIFSSDKEFEELINKVKAKRAHQPDQQSDKQRLLDLTGEQ